MYGLESWAKTINIQVQISAQVGKFSGGNVKCSGPNKQIYMLQNLVKNYSYTNQNENATEIALKVTFCLLVFTANFGPKSHWFKSNKRTVPNKTVLLGKIPKINKRTVYVYLDP